MGALIGALGIMLLLVLMEAISDIPGMLGRWRRSRAEDRFFRRKYHTVY